MHSSMLMRSVNLKLEVTCNKITQISINDGSLDKGQKWSKQETVRQPDKHLICITLVQKVQRINRRNSEGTHKNIILESHFFSKVTQMGKRFSAATRLYRKPRR